METKSALITGSTSGIGRAIAEALAQNGFNIMLNGFGDSDEIEDLRVGLESKFGVKVDYSDADMTKPSQIEQMAQQAHTTFGNIDILINNAGIQHVAPIDEFPIEKWDAIMAINLSSAFHTIRNLLPGMKTKRWGRIINIASAHALVASPFKSAYVAAKHGLLGLTKTVALEVAEMSITCNAVCPGYVLTPLVEGQIDATAKARGLDRESVVRDVLLAAQPTKQFVQTDDLSSLVVYLCSDSAKAINGASLPIDGGWTAQ